MDFLNDNLRKLEQAYAITDNEYPLTYDIFSVHEHNSLEHHLAIMFAWYMISWPLLLLSWIACRIATGEEFG